MSYKILDLQTSTTWHGLSRGINEDREGDQHETVHREVHGWITPTQNERDTEADHGVHQCKLIQCAAGETGYPKRVDITAGTSSYRPCCCCCCWIRFRDAIGGSSQTDHQLGRRRDLAAVIRLLDILWRHEVGRYNISMCERYTERQSFSMGDTKLRANQLLQLMNAGAIWRLAISCDI